MGQNVERLGRLQVNRSNWALNGIRGGQAIQRTAAAVAIETVAAGVQKAARTEGFEGDFGMTVAEALTKIRKDLDSFGEYQVGLNKAIDLANDALEATASGTDGLPEAGLTPDQQNTIDTAAKTNGPVQVSPGVMMTSAEAEQYYRDQAEDAREEQARKMAVALDARLQAIIDGMPTSDYDEPKQNPESSGDDSTGGTSGNYPGVNGGSGGYDGPGVTGGGNVGGGDVGLGGDGSGNGGDGGTGDGDDHTIIRPPQYYYPPQVDPPVIDHPWTPYPDPNGPGDDPRVDGSIDGEVPGVGTGPGTRVGLPGGGSSSLTGVGALGGGLAAVAGTAGLAGRVGGGAGLLGGPGGVGGVGGVGGAGAFSGAGATGVVAPGAAANGGRGGMMAGGAAVGGGAGGRGDKKNRRRGQDLMAFEVEPDDDEIVPDIGAAGAAGTSASDGREELSW